VFGRPEGAASWSMVCWQCDAEGIGFDDKDHDVNTNGHEYFRLEELLGISPGTQMYSSCWQ